MITKQTSGQIQSSKEMLYQELSKSMLLILWRDPGDSICCLWNYHDPPVVTFFPNWEVL